jgi:uncharacterized protein YcfL
MSMLRVSRLKDLVRALPAMAAIVVGIGMFAGCAVNETATVTVEPDGGRADLLESNSGFLAASLSIGNIVVGSAGDLMRVQASLINGSRSDLSFEYKFKWLDQDGFEIAIDGRPWTPMEITAYETKNVQGVAPNASAKSFRILVQD